MEKRNVKYRKMNEELEIMTTELQAADEVQQECISAKAALNRARREIAYHMEECPMGHNTGIFMTPHGRVWHVQHDCHSLSQARTIEQVHPCRWCAMVPPPFSEVNSISGTALQEDMRDFETVHGAMRYETLLTG